MVRQPKLRHCHDCGTVVVEPWARRCRQCLEQKKVVKTARKRVENNFRRYRNINIGRELAIMFPDLQQVLARELDGYSGERRRNRRKEVFQKIGAEGAKIFDL